MPYERPWEKYREWCETYSAYTLSSLANAFAHSLDHHVESDVVYLNLPMQPTIILGSAKAASDLFEKRSHIYSDRPGFVVLKL